ncbi:DUF2232 domain-containing protein [Abyssicoccus albus]|uniref:DUF2232 domain-containing protein n=1 Tax=Abyssicoccus albus TaxID=1817405 RepID=UPI00097E1AF6|nr:DUF2232 domain-containing protein [Abyssicoccus albus]AQL57014.1 hypothetical protein BVH56_08920 [Abyssicoccus albus]
MKTSALDHIKFIGAITFFILLIMFVPIISFLFIPVMVGIGLMYINRNVISYYYTSMILFIILYLFFSPYVFIIFAATMFSILFIHRLIQKRESFEKITLASGSLFGAYVLMFILILQGFKEIPLFDQLFETLHHSYYDALEQYEKMGMAIPDAVVDVQLDAINMLYVSIPSYIIFGGIILFWIANMIGFVIAKKHGVIVPKMKPIWAWNFSKSLAYIYLVLMLMNIMNEDHQGSFYSVVTNSINMVEWFMIVQGITVIVFFFAYKKIPHIITGIVVVIALLFNPITMLIGLIDLLFKLKEMIVKSKR